MNDFDPHQNTMVAAYGPPEYFESQTDDSNNGNDTGSESFFSKIITVLQKLLEFIKNLFK